MLAWHGPYCPYIHCADDTPRPVPWAIRQRRLAHWLLVTSLDGSENIEVEGRAVSIPARGSYLIPPGCLHHLASQRNRPAWVHFDLVYDARREAHPHAGSYDSDLGARRAFLQPDARAMFGNDLPLVVPRALTGLFAAGVPRLVRRWAEGGPLAVLDATHQLAGLLLALVAEVLPPDGPGATVAERLDRAERIARDHLASRFDVTAMARAAGMSRGHFTTVYARSRGYPPARFLREARLDLAATLLRRPDLSASQVGALVGYPEATVFGRAFRARFGITPGAWRSVHQCRVNTMDTR